MFLVISETYDTSIDETSKKSSEVTLVGISTSIDEVSKLVQKDYVDILTRNNLLVLDFKLYQTKDIKDNLSFSAPGINWIIKKVEPNTLLNFTFE